MRRSAQRLSRFLGRHAFQAMVLLIITLILYGAVSETRLAVALVGFASARAAFLVWEALQRRRTADDWQRLESDLAARYAEFGPEDLEEEAHGLGLEGRRQP